MITPAAAFIESTIDSVGSVEVPTMIDAVKELRVCGAHRLDAFQPLPHLTNLERGYLLGLQVAETMALMTPKLPEDTHNG